MSKLAITLAILAVAVLNLMLAASADSSTRVSSTSICSVDVSAETELLCPVTCFKPDPVCGADGVTYWCGCAEARCAGAEVAKTGFCDVGNGGNGPLSGQALLLIHIVWLILLGFFVVMGLF